jgi:hypothetical protein
VAPEPASLLGDGEAWCVLTILKPTTLAASAQGNQPWETGVGNGDLSVFNLEAGTAESATRKNVVRITFRQRDATTRKPCGTLRRDGNELRVTVLAHESNCKMAQIFRRRSQTWDVG